MTNFGQADQRSVDSDPASPSPTALAIRRARLQLHIDPAAFAHAIAWRALRRPLLGLAGRLAPKRGEARLSTSSEVFRTLLESASAVPHWVVEAILSADLVVFGRAFRGEVGALLARDRRFVLEKRRAQVVQPLLAALWQGGLGPGVRERVERRIRAELAEANASAERGYPMDEALQGLGIALCLEVARHGRMALGAAEQTVLRARLEASVLRCYADPEYSGGLSNNHHLSCAAVLLVLAMNLEASPRIERIRRSARAWLRAAVSAQFGSDGAHFEASSGYHMCCLEALALALLADPESAADPVLVAALARAQYFACALLREDGSYPLIGDFDASRILRLGAAYRQEPAAEVSYALAQAPGVRIGARCLEHSDSDAVPEFVARLPLGARALVLASPPPRRCARRHSAPAPAPACAGEADLGLLEALREADWPAFESVLRYDFGAGFEPLAEIRHFEDAGLLVARSAGAHLVLRDGCVGQRGLGTHSHLDTLSLDAWTAGGAMASDPGSPAYLSRPELRRAYRSARAHFTPLWFREIGSLEHPFAILSPPPRARLFSRPGIIGGLARFEHAVFVRVASVRAGRLLVLDAASGAALQPFPFSRAPPRLPTYEGPLERLTADPHEGPVADLHGKDAGTRETA